MSAERITPDVFKGQGGGILPVSTNFAQSSANTKRPRSKLLQRLFLLLSALCYAYFGYGLVYSRTHIAHPSDTSTDVVIATHGQQTPRLGPLLPSEHSDVCPQPKTIHPSKHRELAEDLDRLYADETYRLKAYNALSGAVQIPYVRFALGASAS